MRIRLAKRGFYSGIVRMAIGAGSVGTSENYANLKDSETQA